MSEEGKEIDLIDLVKYIWAAKKSIIKWTVVGLFVGVVVAFSLPKEYVCKVSLAPEKKDGAKAGSMGGLASMMGVSMGASQDGISEDLYPSIIQSSPFISEFTGVMVKKDSADLPLINYLLEEQRFAWWSYLSPSKLIATIMGSNEITISDDEFRPTGFQRGFESIFSSRINLKSDSKTNIINVEVKMQDPESAAIVADSVVSKLQRYMTSYFTSKARLDLESNLVILEQSKAKFYAADSLYAAAVDRNKNLISQLAQVRIERLKNERDIAFSIYKQLASQAEVLKNKLQEDTPVVTIIEPARVPNMPASPNKLLIIVAFSFLAAAACCGKQVFQYITSENQSE